MRLQHLSKIFSIVTLTFAVAVILSSCGKGNSQTPDEPQTDEIKHVFTIKSSTPVEIDFELVSMDDLVFDGQNQKTNGLSKKVAHTGAKTYEISTRSHTLSSFLIFSRDDIFSDDTILEYTWSEYVNDKLTNTEKKTANLSVIYETKNYVTSLK